jgi:hypothetical protein
MLGMKMTGEAILAQALAATVDLHGNWRKKSLT